MDELEVIIPKKEWFTLKECAELKGICYKTFCNKTILQPNKGTPDGWIGGRKAYLRTTLQKWIVLTDADILKEEAKS